MERTLHVHLIKPSFYDEDGYVIRYKKGVLPSNTLACLYGLTRGVAEEKQLGDVSIECSMLDEMVDRVDPTAIIKKIDKNQLHIFCLCGVQTSQFPRASDIAREFSKLGQKVMIGGFHISGIFSVFGQPSEEMEDLMELGVTLVAGEVEDSWAQLLRDFISDEMKPVYNYLNEKPDLKTKYLPQMNAEYLKKFALTGFATMDCGRGCPYRCSFCTIINVHGNQMRCRDVNHLREHFIRSYRESGIRFYFFTDDNFSRNKNWQAIFDILIQLREEGMDLDFMMQVDVLAYRIPAFVEKAAKAGCTQVFMGMESVNPLNLASAGKKQNRAHEYREMIETWRRAGVMTHVGYIIGFPHDSVESVKDDVHTLAYDVGVDLASFFVLTPLPGSEDHRQLVNDQTPMDSDYNSFDSFHPVVDHPLMTRKDWQSVYDYAWNEFYSVPRIEHTLRRLKGRKLRDMLGSYLWYSYAAFVDRQHPMICGFHRLKDRQARRSGMLFESGAVFYLRRSAELIVETARTARILFRFGYLYLKFRKGLHSKVKVEKVFPEPAPSRAQSPSELTAVDGI